MPSYLQEPFVVVSHQARVVMEALGTGPDAYGMVYGDMYPENVLLKAGELVPIDFEDCGFGYWLWDIAVALSEQPWTGEWYRQRDALLAGYGQVHSLPGSQLAHLDLFMAAQYATGVLWASQSRVQSELPHQPQWFSGGSRARSPAEGGSLVGQITNR